MCISIHALRGEGDDEGLWRPTKDISIHALRGEGDQNNTPKKARDYYFNPRPPWGGRPIQTVFEILLVVFQSTPSVGRATKGMIENGKQHIHFNPRPPWGGRQYPAVLTDEVFEFQSTPSVGRATPPDGTPPSVYEISIHALRGEGDDNKPYEIDIRPAISIHALRGEGDQLLL